MPITETKNGFTVKAYPGDAKTLLAFNLTKAKTKNLAGFTIQVQPDGLQAFFLSNNLQFKNPSQHSQVGTELPNSTINAPLHRFRWVHVPGSLHQGTKPFFGPYIYTVTPRYFDDQNSLLPIDNGLSVAVNINVAPFVRGKLKVGFTRGFTQSQAFVHHFGPHPILRPKSDDLIFDTSQVAGKNPKGFDYTFADEYDWMGFTARDLIFEILNEVLGDNSLRLDMFAYDLNEPDLLKALLELAKQGRVRLILDDAGLHHSTKDPKPEDRFTDLFTQAAVAPAAILRGNFGRYAHNKVLIVSDANGAKKVLTGSTNFSLTGLYVNSNHVIIFDDAGVAGTYAKVFEDAWTGKVSVTFNQTVEAGKVFRFASNGLPRTEITYAPHLEAFATQNLNDLVARIDAEGNQKGGSVLFAVMAIDTGTGPVLPALRSLHANETIFSYGIS